MAKLYRLLNRIERFVSTRWYNPLASIYLNFRCLSFKQARYLPIAIYGRPKFLELSGKIKIDSLIKFGMITINKNHMDAPSFQGCQSELLIRGKIVFYGKGQIDTGTKIYVGRNALLELGDKFKICDMVNVGCYKHISLGNTTRITHRCQLFDTNYHFLANINKNVIPSTIKPIRIGNNVWVGNSTTICGGSIIPDNTIITSNSLVNKKFDELPAYPMIGGIPAKLITSGFRRIENLNLTMELYKYYESNDELYRIPATLSENIYLDE